MTHRKTFVKINLAKNGYLLIYAEFIRNPGNTIEPIALQPSCPVVQCHLEKISAPGFAETAVDHFADDDHRFANFYLIQRFEVGAVKVFPGKMVQQILNR